MSLIPDVCLSLNRGGTMGIQYFLVFCILVGMVGLAICIGCK